MKSREQVIREVINQEINKQVISVFDCLISSHYQNNDVMWYNQHKYRFYVWALWYVMHYEKGYLYNDIMLAFNKPSSHVNYAFCRITNIIRNPKKNEESERVYEIYTKISEIS